MNLGHRLMPQLCRLGLEPLKFELPRRWLWLRTGLLRDRAVHAQPCQRHALHAGLAPAGYAHWMPGPKVLETSSRLCVKASCAIIGNAQLVLVSSFHRERQCLFQVFLFIIIPFTFRIRDGCHLMFPYFCSVEQKLSKTLLSSFWICFTQEEAAQQLRAGL